MPSPCSPPGQPPNNPPKSRLSHSSNHGEIDCDQHHGRVGRPPRLRPSPPSAAARHHPPRRPPADLSCVRRTRQRCPVCRRAVSPTPRSPIPCPPSDSPLPTSPSPHSWPTTRPLGTWLHSFP